MEWNDYNNSPRNAAVKNAVESENGVHTIWLTRNFTADDVRQAILNSACTGILLEAEIPSEFPDGTANPQAVDWEDVANKTSDLNVYKGVVCNTAPFTHGSGLPWPERAAPLVESGWTYHAECYDRYGDPATWAEESESYVAKLGWKSIQPVLGLYNGRTLASFPTRNQYRNWSVWAAEFIL